jgi:uncharacterized YccA/Bax inhibitor family protein
MGDEEHEDIAVGRLLRAPSFFLLLVSAMLGAAIITLLDPTLGPHLEDILGYGPGTIGIAFAVIAGVYAAFTPLAGCASCPKPVMSGASEKRHYCKEGK